MHSYYAFGLNIISELQCPEFSVASFAVPDLVVKFESVPKTLTNILYSRPGFDVNHTSILLRIPDVGRFIIENGRRIGIQPEADADTDAIRLYLLGSCMGAVLHQRGFTPIHGSAVSYGNSAIIIGGHSGAGKSTTATALAVRGHRVLADDISAVSLQNQQVIVTPGYPQMKLWKSAVEHFKFQHRDYGEVRSGIAKYFIPVVEKFETEQRPVQTLLRIEKENVEVPQIITLKGSERFHALRKTIYRKKYNIAALKRRYFNQCHQLSERLGVHILIRPETGNCVEFVADLIDAHYVKGRDSLPLERAG